MNPTMRTAPTSRSRAVAGAVAFLALAVAFAAGCGSGTGDPAESAKPTGPARSAEPTSHPTQDHSISAEVGERFTLTFEENASTREHWYLADPKPDASVVRSQGQKSESDSGDEPVPGAGSGLTFTFEATGEGSTEIVLTHCTFAAPCDGSGTSSPAPSSTASATPSRPERVTYTVTVS